jgi:uncharacterized protein YyaL (SSP411 family)
MWWLIGACATGAGPAPEGATPPSPPSRLTHETSPYLRAHADDLVRWWPWGDAPFAAARERDVPALVVIGYATCHWCHVLAEESFRDAELAGVVEAGFVPVLVDREERPDVDAAMLAAAQRLTGKGLGWPLLVVTSPDGEVLFATSYLPARDGDRGVKTGLLTVLRDLSGRWATDRAALIERGRALAADLAARGAAGGPVPPSVWREVDQRLSAMADREHGGFGRAPKFPRPTTLDAWLAWSVRHGSADGRDHVAFTLRSIADSALHDPLEGGFHRYTVDAAWREPHFEKTLTDNAQLVRSFLAARRSDAAPIHAEAAADAARWLAEQWVPRGLASALDADSAGPDGVPVEGARYLFTRAELLAALGPERGALAADALGVTGDLPTAPRRAAPLPDDLRAEVLALRLARPAPARDDKVIAGWQGLAVAALARAGRELPDPLAHKHAERLGTLLDAELAAGPPPRTLGGGAPALLDDLAFLAEGFLELFQSTGDERWLVDAERCVAWADERFRRPEGGHWRGAPTVPPLPVRPTADEDGSEPPAAAVLARVRLRLAALRGDDTLRNRVSEDLVATSGAILGRPASHATWLQVADELASPPPEIVIVWPPGTDPGPLRAALYASPAPGALELVLPAERVAALGASVPLLAGKDAVDAPTAFVCTLGVCQAPATTPGALRAAISAAQR